MLNVDGKNVISQVAEYTLGQKRVGPDGRVYVYVKIASGGVSRAYSAMVVDEDGVAVDSVSNDINAINPGFDVDASSENKYFWAIVPGVIGTPVNVFHTATATATASLDNVPLVNYSASSYPGTVKSGTLTSAVSGSYAGANPTTAELIATINTMQSEINAQNSSKLIGKNTAQLTTTRKAGSKYYMLSAASTEISAVNAPISADFRLGDYVYYNGVYQPITAIDTASGGVTAQLSAALGATGALTATGSGFSASGGAIEVYRANYLVDAVFRG